MHNQPSKFLVMGLVVGGGLFAGCRGDIASGDNGGDGNGAEGGNGLPADPNDPSSPGTPSDPGAGGSAATDPVLAPDPSAPDRPGRGGLRRLTSQQYWNSVEDMFGTGLAAMNLDPDSVAGGGLFATGASQVATSRVGVELYESAALDVCRQVFIDSVRRSAAVGCKPTGTSDATCARTYLTKLGRRAFRRPLAPDEIDRFVGIFQTAAATAPDFWQAASVATSAVLQSPFFLYRAELGDVATAGDVKPLTGLEIASRLSFMVQNRGPDDALLDAAMRGDLLTPPGLQRELDRLLAGKTSHQAVREYFGELFHIGTFANGLDPVIAGLMKEEALRTIDDIAITRKADAFEILTGRTTFATYKLAHYYGIPEPNTPADVYAVVERPPESGRAGFLGMGAFLSANGRMDETSPTRRGKLIRETLLCQAVPPPPDNVAALPPARADLPTKRQRLEVHRNTPACAACHALMDPIGLTYEVFDWKSQPRTEEGGQAIDTSGDLDGQPFANPVELGQKVAARPEAAWCFVRNLFRNAVGHEESPDETHALGRLATAFSDGGRRYDALLRAMVADDGFRKVYVPASEAMP